jgi:hypothetical protein
MRCANSVVTSSSYTLYTWPVSLIGTITPRIYEFTLNTHVYMRYSPVSLGTYPRSLDVVWHFGCRSTAFYLNTIINEHIDMHVRGMMADPQSRAAESCYWEEQQGAYGYREDTATESTC